MKLNTNPIPVHIRDIKAKVYYIDTNKLAEHYVKDLEKFKTLAFDIETSKKSKYIDHPDSGLCPKLSGIRLIQLYGGGDIVYVFDMWKVKLDTLKDLLQTKKLIAHNGVFEMSFLLHAGVPIPNTVCTQIMADLVYRAETVEKFDSPRILVNLADCVYREFNILIDKGSQTSNWNKSELTFRQIQYAGLDSIVTFMLAKELLPRLKKYKLGRSFNLLCELQNVIAEMKLNGIPFNTKKHKDMIKAWEKEKDVKRDKCSEFFGAINLDSPTQLSFWAKEKLSETELSQFDTTDKGSISFNSKSLIAAKDVKGIPEYLDYKKTSGWLSKFGEKLEDHIHPITKNIHSSFWITGIATGRMSSSNPNSQQFPRDLRFRKLFECDKDSLLVGADFSQIEVRVQAECSQDEVMLDVYRNGKDIYKVTAANILGVPIEKIKKDSDERRMGKTIVLALGYGMGANKFAKKVFEDMEKLITLDEAYKMVNGYHETFKGCSAWCDKVRNLCESHGICSTLLGRLRRLHPENVYTKAPNHVIQGTAAQILYASLIHLKNKNLPDLKFIAPIHDEIILSAPKEVAKDYAPELEDSMVQGYLQVFPQGITRGLVSASVGRTWADIH